MLALNVHLPENLHQAAREVAAHEGVSLDQLIVRALGEKIASVQTHDDFDSGEDPWERLWALIPDADPQSVVATSSRAS